MNKEHKKIVKDKLIRFRFILKSNSIRIFVSSILISVFMISILDGNLPFVFSREFTWLNFALPIIFIVSLINRAKHLKNSILKGSVIGILSWLFLFTYEYIDVSINTDWGFFLGLMIFAFMPLLIISSIIGMVISYFVKKQIDKRRAGKKTPVRK